MYRVWFKFVDKYYKNYAKARKACKSFIISQTEDKELIDMMLVEFEQYDRVNALCGIEEIRCEDEDE